MNRFHSCWNEMNPFHFGWNGMTIPFWPEWSATIPFLLEWKLSFLPEWNGHSIPAGMECHFFNNLKKYAAGRADAGYFKIKAKLNPA
jgi:hypothetical protein